VNVCLRVDALQVKPGTRERRRAHESPRIRLFCPALRGL